MMRPSGRPLPRRSWLQVPLETELSEWRRRVETALPDTGNPRTRELLRELYAPFNRSHDRIVAMDVRSAELTKYDSPCSLGVRQSISIPPLTGR